MFVTFLLRMVYQQKVNKEKLLLFDPSEKLLTLEIVGV